MTRTQALLSRGLRVTEPCNLRIKDVDFVEQKLTIRMAKGAKDRVVNLPSTLCKALRDQIEAARVPVTKQGDHSQNLLSKCQETYSLSTLLSVILSDTSA